MTSCQKRGSTEQMAALADLKQLTANALTMLLPRECMSAVERAVMEASIRYVYAAYVDGCYVPGIYTTQELAKNAARRYKLEYVARARYGTPSKSCCVGGCPFECGCYPVTIIPHLADPSAPFDEWYVYVLADCAVFVSNNWSLFAATLTDGRHIPRRETYRQKLDPICQD